MKLQSSFLGVRAAFLILLCFAFACKRQDGKNANLPAENGRTNTAAATSTATTPPAATNSETSDALTEDIVKQIFTKQANSAAVQSGSISPKPATLAFESIQFGITRKANIKDESEGVPPGATMHPVRAIYSIVNHSPGKDRADKYNEDYYFFKDKSGAWARLSMKAGPIK